MIVLDHGPAALSRRALANALGIGDSTVRRLIGPGVDLRTLAMGQTAERRRIGRWRQPHGTPSDKAWAILCQLLPDEESRVAEELVALKISVDLAPVPPVVRRVDEDGLTLAERGRLGLTGKWPERSAELVDGDPRETHTDPRTGGASDPMVATLVTDRRDLEDNLIGRAVAVLEVPDPDRPAVAECLRTLLVGLNVRTCLGDLTPERAVEILRHEIARVDVRSSAA